MIIQCDHCSAKFRIDDAKLANGAVKVRCAKCKEVFVVEREESPTESEPALDAVVPPPPSAVTGEVATDAFSGRDDFSFDQEQPADSATQVTQAIAADEFDWKDAAEHLDTTDSNTEVDRSSFGAEKPLQEEKAASGSDTDFDFGDINLQSSLAEDNPPSQEDFSIDFGEVSFAEPSPPSSMTAQPSSGGPVEDFSFDTPPSTDSSPSVDSDDFLLSFNDDNANEPKTSAAIAEGGESVNFGDFSFGDMADDKAEQPVVQEQFLAPDMDVEPAPQSMLSDEELVPTSLVSRKKDGSRFPLFLIFGAILIVVALAGSGVYFFGGPKVFSKVGLGFLVDWYGEKGAEEGSMVIRNINSSYVVNNSAGELFVVKGEAVNNFKKSRASVQVKVSILGTGGAVLVGKSAFCGNVLSNEQLASLPLAKIEEAMNNQFGDSLANLGVKPGSAIPFVVVMSGVPKEATDFSVQIVGSTVATQ